jgi:hypothetical protein
MDGIIKMTADELKNIPFPNCYNKCELVNFLGVGECENIETCQHKFKKEDKMKKKRLKF